MADFQDGSEPYLNPYYKPGIISFDADLLEAAHTRALQIAERLNSGDVSPLPDEVLELLKEHTAAVNTRGTGELRYEIAGKLEVPPFSPEEAQAIGGAILNLVNHSNDKVVELHTLDLMFAESFKQLGEKLHPPHTD